ncbi:MAG: peptidyl-prolyl cis-trans isomerase [Planctomycetes bacterium]|nr:peptidyl-prolyl cis-trans isomerase [Planctomycetota bacterium]
MLKNLTRKTREHERIALFILAIVTALAFGITGVMLDVLSGGKDNANYAGQMFGKKVTNAEFQDYRYRWGKFTQWILQHFNNMHFYFAYLPPFDMVDLELWTKKQDEFLDELTWNVMMLSNLADKAGIKVTDEEVKDYLKTSHLVADREKGFDLDKYRSFLGYLQISEPAFERTAAEFLKVYKYRNFVVHSVAPTLDDIFKEYTQQNAEIKVRWCAFEPEDFTDKMRIKNNDEIKEYFEVHQSDYEVPGKVQIEYIFAANEDMKAKTAEPTEADMEKYYTKHKDDEFKDKQPADVKEEVRKKVKEESAKDLSLETITKAEQKINSATLMDKEVSLPALADEFGIRYNKTGWFAGDNVKELEKELGDSTFLSKQVSSFQVNEVSSTVSTDKGCFIFRLLGKKDVYVPGLTAQLEEKVRHDIIKSKATELAKQAAHNLAQSITNKVNEDMKANEKEPKLPDTKATAAIKLKWFANLTDEGFNARETGYIKSSDYGDAFKPGVSQDFIKKVFKLQEGEFEVLDEGTGPTYYLVQVANQRGAETDKFEAKKKDLLNSVKRTKEDEFVKQWKETIKKETGWEKYPK